MTGSSGKRFWSRYGSLLTPEAVIAKRVGSALTLLDTASQVSGGARKKLLGNVAQQLDALLRRVSRAQGPGDDSGHCASTLEGLIESAQALARTLAG